MTQHSAFLYIQFTVLSAKEGIIMTNIPIIKLGLISVSRDCFPVALSEARRAAVAAAFGDITNVKLPWKTKGTCSKP